MVEFVAAVGEIDEQANSLSTIQIDTNRNWRLAAANRRAAVAAGPFAGAVVDKNPAHDASAASRLVVNRQFRLK